MMPHAFDLRKLNREAGAIRAKDSALLSLTKQGYTPSTQTRPLTSRHALAAPRHIFSRRRLKPVLWDGWCKMNSSV